MMQASREVGGAGGVDGADGQGQVFCRAGVGQCDVERDARGAVLAKQADVLG